MQKALLFGALLLTATGSWAFYPKATASSGYMMVVSRFSVTGINKANNTVSTIAPDGQVQTQAVDVKIGLSNTITNSYDQLHITELKKINELQQAGWRVVSATQIINGTNADNETTFLLEKQ